MHSPSLHDIGSRLPNTFFLALFVYTTLSRLNWVITTTDNTLSWMAIDWEFGGGMILSLAVAPPPLHLYSDILHTSTLITFS